MTFIYLVCALRTNVVFVAMFTGLLILITVLTGSYWNAAKGKAEVAQQQQYIAGVFGIITTSLGWYTFAAQMLASVDFPVQLPVGDLSHFITPLSEKLNIKEHQQSALLYTEMEMDKIYSLTTFVTSQLILFTH